MIAGSDDSMMADAVRSVLAPVASTKNTRTGCDSPMLSSAEDGSMMTRTEPVGSSAASTVTGKTAF